MSSDNLLLALQKFFKVGFVVFDAKFKKVCNSLSCYLAWDRPQFKVFNAVVSFYSISMMDYLKCFKRSSKMVLHDISMFLINSTSNANYSIPIWIYMTSFPKRGFIANGIICVAFFRTVMSFVPIKEKWRSPNLNSTSIATNNFSIVSDSIATLMRTSSLPMIRSIKVFFTKFITANAYKQSCFNQSPSFITTTINFSPYSIFFHKFFKFHNTSQKITPAVVEVYRKIYDCEGMKNFLRRLYFDNLILTEKVVFCNAF